MGKDPFEGRLGWINRTAPEQSPTNHPEPLPDVIQSNSEQLSNQNIQSNMDKQSIHRKSGSAQAGLKAGWTRATFIVREDLLQEIKALAYLERVDIKDILTAAWLAYRKEREAEIAAAKSLYEKKQQ